MDIMDVLNERLRTLMREHKVKAAPLARRANLNESAVRDILRGRSRNPGIVTLSKIAAVLKLRTSALFEAGEAWPVVGKVTGDGDVTEVLDTDGMPRVIENPFVFQRERPIQALIAAGNAVSPLAFEGDVLLFEKRESGVSDADLGRPCICERVDGASSISIVRLAEEPGRYHLAPISIFGANETNVELRCASRVAMVLPRAMMFDMAALLQTHEADPSVLHEEQASLTPP